MADTLSLKDRNFLTQLLTDNKQLSHAKVTLPSGIKAYLKTTYKLGFFESEVKGLHFIKETETLQIPEILSWSDYSILLTYVNSCPPSKRAAEEFGAELAKFHRIKGEYFGATWQGYIGPIEMDNTPTSNFVSFYKNNRLIPFLEKAKQLNRIDRKDELAVRNVIDSLDVISGPVELPSRIHGDLWNGNILYAANSCFVIDPAAHFGHRESDIAMLKLFSAPYEQIIIDSYNKTYPLSEGWQYRVGLHQLFYLLVYCVLFGGSYGISTGRKADLLLEDFRN